MLGWMHILPAELFSVFADLDDGYRVDTGDVGRRDERQQQGLFFREKFEQSIVPRECRAMQVRRCE